MGRSYTSTTFSTTTWRCFGGRGYPGRDYASLSAKRCLEWLLKKIPTVYRKESSHGGEAALAMRGNHLGSLSSFQSWPAKWQATKRPLSFISSGGSTSEQIFCAIGQRVWNRQAGGGLTGDGISPFRRIGFRAASRSGSGTGTELSSTLV